MEQMISIQEGRTCNGRNDSYNKGKEKNVRGESWHSTAQQDRRHGIWYRRVNGSDEIVPHSPDQNALHNEAFRKEVDGYEVISDTCIRYKCTLEETELANTYISEIGIYDADGDMVAMKAFMKKGKDADMEVVFECDDTF